MSWYSEKHYKPIQRNPDTDLYFQRFFADIIREGEILDIGCSIGNFLSLWPDKIIGVDCDEDAIRIACERGLRARVMDVNLGIDFPDNSFEAVNCEGTLDHLKEPLLVLKEIKRVLKPKGFLVCITGNMRHYGIKEFWDDYTHRTAFTPRSLYQITYDAGFREFEIIDEYKFPLVIRILLRHPFVTKAAKETYRIFSKFLYHIRYSKKGRLAEKDNLKAIHYRSPALRIQDISYRLHIRNKKRMILIAKKEG